MEDRAKKTKKFVRDQFEPILVRMLTKRDSVIPPQIKELGKTSNNPDILLVIHLNDELDKTYDETIEEIEYILAIDWDKDNAEELFLESRKRFEGLKKKYKESSEMLVELLGSLTKKA